MDRSDELQASVVKAFADNTPLRIQGGNTKAFYGNALSGETLDLSGHNGVRSYEPTELVISAYAGTPLKEIAAILDEQNQMLAFEPPGFGDAATLGGTIACNLSGPRRAYSGAARDFVLGTRVLNGKGEILSFGGEVMKNVAGYDVSRLMSGAMGTLGVILDVSLKTIPKPEAEMTLVQTMDAAKALKKLSQWSRLPLPLSASCIDKQQLYLRLSGTEEGLQAAKSLLGGEQLTTVDSDSFWQSIKEQQYDFFLQDRAVDEHSLWRLSVAPNAAELDIVGDTLYEWGGALRWLKSNAAAEKIRNSVTPLQGHAIRFRNYADSDGSEKDSSEEVFHPLPAHLLKLHQNLKQAFDPKGILNPYRMYKAF
ncbi:MAG: glycolate oxidase subunit GlcE [Gammaproteobacteria bacterium]|nr:glycolate oxidase subunit GlcE [Gammaproteobacteria bacterium]